ncbi:MAG: MFS transporter, partial [Pseudonocardia sp.]|nr:MFS transporter [Pseudonocardia sp.]
ASAAGYTGRERFSILASAILGYTLDGYNLLILSFVLPALPSSMGLTGGQAGFVVSAQLLASVVGGVVFGWYADRRGRRAGLVASIFVFSVGALLSGFSWDLWSLTFFRFLTGIGLGGEWGLGMALFSEAWNRRRGLGSALIQSCLPLGSLLAGLVAAAIITAQGPDGWRWALASGFVPVLLCVAVRFFMPESRLWREYDQLRREGRLNQPASRSCSEFWEILQGGTRRLWFLGFLLVGGYMLSYYGVTTFMPTMIVRSYHQTPAVWSAVNAFAVWVVIPIKVVVGALGDRLGRRFAALVPIILMVVASIGFLLTTRSGFFQAYPGSIWTWNVFWIFFIWSAGNSATSSLGAWLSEIFPTSVRATAISTTYMFGRGLAALSPVLVPLAGAGNLALGMGLISIIGCAMFLVAGALLPETRNRVLRATETAALSREPTTANG